VKLVFNKFHQVILQTHSHILALSVFVPAHSLSPSCSFSLLYLSLSHPLTFSLSPSCSLRLSPSHLLTLSPSHSHPLTVSFSLCPSAKPPTVFIHPLQPIENRCAPPNIPLQPPCCMHMPLEPPRQSRPTRPIPIQVNNSAPSRPTPIPTYLNFAPTRPSRLPTHFNS
jgi:hypothetical protein